MADPARILLLANFADRVGGGEESLLTLARGLDRRRYLLHAAVPGEGEIAETLRGIDIPVAVLPMAPLRPWTLSGIIRSYLRLRRCAETWQIQLFHAHGSRVALYAGLVARHHCIPLVWHVRIADRDPILDPILLLLSTRVIAISQAVKTRFASSHHFGKVQVVYNGVDVEYWSAVEPPESPSKKPVVLLVGRLSPGKGQATLLQAVPEILQKTPGARFVLLGADCDGESRHLRALACELDVEAAVDFQPWLADPRPVFREAEVLVLPSRSEGFGRVLMEAACLGKPVVASRVGGIPESVVDRETGLLIPSDNPSALADAVLSLLHDPHLRLRLGAAARQRVLRHFTARQHVEGVEAVYSEVLDPNPNRGAQARVSHASPPGSPSSEHPQPFVRGSGRSSGPRNRPRSTMIAACLRVLPVWVTLISALVAAAALVARSAWPSFAETLIFLTTVVAMWMALHASSHGARVACAVSWLALLVALGLPTPTRSMGLDFRTFYDGARVLFEQGRSPYTVAGTTAFPFPTFLLVRLLSMGGQLPLEYTFLAFVGLQFALLGVGYILTDRIARREDLPRDSNLPRRILQAGLLFHPAVLAGICVGNSSVIAGAAVMCAVWFWRCEQGRWSPHASAIFLNLGWMSKPQLILVTPFFLGVWYLERGRRPDCRSRAAAIGRILIPWASAILALSVAVQWPGSLHAYRDFFGVAVTWHTRIAETYSNNYALSAILAKSLVRSWAVPVSGSLPLLASGIAVALVCWNGVSFTPGRMDSLRAFLPWLLTSLFWTTLVWEWYFSLVLTAPILMMALEPRGPKLAGDAFRLRLPIGVACTMMFSSFLFTLGLIQLYCHSQALRLREIEYDPEP